MAPISQRSVGPSAIMGMVLSGTSWTFPMGRPTGGLSACYFRLNHPDLLGEL